MPRSDRGVPRPSVQGEKHPAAVLTWEDVRAIRQEYAAGNTSQRKLGAKFNVSGPNINDILHNKAWVDPDYTPQRPRS